MELDRVELEHYDYLGDYSDRPGVVQATVEPSNIWLEVRGGYGAHSTGYDLLRFDGRKLHGEVTAGTPGGSAGWLADLNGDGTPEVVLDRSDYYVFCFACGVVRWNYEVRRWDGSHMVEVQLAPVPETAPAELRRLTDQAVAQAQAGLWKDAWAAVSQTLALDAKDETAQWDAALIRLVAEARAMQAASGAYPLLDHLFYGDYPAALDVMRAYTPAELFARDTPLVSGTAAAGWEPELTNWITETVNPALEARPDLAAAYFLRGWAVHLSYPDNPAALADVERAAQLAPQEKLFAESAGYLKGQR